MYIYTHIRTHTHTHTHAHMYLYIHADGEVVKEAEAQAGERLRCVLPNVRYGASLATLIITYTFRVCVYTVTSIYLYVYFNTYVCVF